MGPLEKAARELCSLDTRNPDALEPGNDPYSNNREIVDGTCANGDPGFFVWRLYEGRVRAVLQAIREPSEAMLNADDGDDPRWDGVFVRKVWQAMIDAALAETETN